MRGIWLVNWFRCLCERRRSLGHHLQYNWTSKLRDRGRSPILPPRRSPHVAFRAGLVTELTIWVNLKVNPSVCRSTERYGEVSRCTYFYATTLLVMRTTRKIAIPSFGMPKSHSSSTMWKEKLYTLELTDSQL